MKKKYDQDLNAEKRRRERDLQDHADEIKRYDSHIQDLVSKQKERSEAFHRMQAENETLKDKVKDYDSVKQLNRDLEIIN